MVASAWEWLRQKKPLVDAFFASPLLLVSIPWIAIGGQQLGTWRATLLTIGLLGPLVLRRTFPRAVLATVALVSAVQCAMGVPPTAGNIAVLMGIYTVTANCSFRWGLAAASVGELGAVLATLRYAFDRDATYTGDATYTFVILAVVVAGVWLLGLHMRTRRAYLRSVEERAERLERERDNEVRMAMASERARIARELHDVVAHNVSVIVVQADGASYAIDTDVRRARQALATISATGRTALAEMRRLLGVLRENDDVGVYAPQPGALAHDRFRISRQLTEEKAVSAAEVERRLVAEERQRIARELHDVVAHGLSLIQVQATSAPYRVPTMDPASADEFRDIARGARESLAEMRRLLGVLRENDDVGVYAPQPGVADLDDLIDQMRASGLRVEFDVEGTPAPMSEGRQLTVYRVVQEALTNALKHGGPHVTVSVRLRYTGDTLEVRVVDDGRGAAAPNDGRGHGLVGMRERVAVYGGSVRAGPRAGGGFEVVARIPVREDAGAVGGPARGVDAARAASVSANGAS